MTQANRIDTWPVITSTGSWWLGYTDDTTDDEARKLAALKLSCPESRIEILRTGGCVLARRKKETEDAATD